jgi:hypothetical protein
MTEALSRLRQVIRAQMNELADHAATRGCQTWDEYNYCTGQIQGLAWAERELLDIEKGITQAEEEADGQREMFTH